MHERAWLKDVYSVDVKVVCETTSWEHSQELKKVLTQSYQNVVFNDIPLAIGNY